MLYLDMFQFARYVNRAEFLQSLQHYGDFQTAVVYKYILLFALGSKDLKG